MTTLVYDWFQNLNIIFCKFVKNHKFIHQLKLQVLSLKLVVFYSRKSSDYIIILPKIKDVWRVVVEDPTTKIA